MYKDKRVEKKKTVVMKRCLNPVFNESFAFDIPTERLRETTIVITVMDKDRLSRNDVIGKVGTAACPAEGWQLGDSPSWGPWLVAPGAVSSWRRWSVVGTPRAGVTSGPGRGVWQRGQAWGQCGVPCLVCDAPSLPPRRAGVGVNLPVKTKVLDDPHHDPQPRAGFPAPNPLVPGTVKLVPSRLD